MSQLLIELKNIRLEKAMLIYDRMAQLENELYPINPVFSATSITKYQPTATYYDSETDARNRNQSLLTSQF